MTRIDRTATARALAKAIAHKAAGNDGAANDWAVELVNLLGCAGILTDDARIARNQRLPVEA